MDLHLTVTMETEFWYLKWGGESFPSWRISLDCLKGHMRQLLFYGDALLGGSPRDKRDGGYLASHWDMGDLALGSAGSPPLSVTSGISPGFMAKTKRQTHSYWI